ncbi:BatD family protein [Sagittula sp. NFXS13]|uniref:hypothetical protein n=1 Tax=Sagittula sp. NFXS13 TaxID=2819095 RepID=UPI0032E04109
MRFLIMLLLACFAPMAVLAQSRSVDPDDLQLSVTVEDTGQTPFARELVMLTIRGVYRRHITRETLEQPKLEGFNWTQLGPDIWREERLRGQAVKVLERRMALYPERAGTLEIGAFTHHLTLTDEGDDWFEHTITSKPISIEVAPMPEFATGDWWFPVKSLKVSDQWSNTPDQLSPGEGVLRIVRIEALGVTPEMIPPMPDLTSPSGMVFPHPEKRLLELSPEGPVTHAFWRWTIQPTNGRSAVVEPIRFTYFDTRERVTREVVISAQRVAYDAAELPPVPKPEMPATLPGWPLALLGTGVLAALAIWGLRGQRLDRQRLYHRVPLVDPQAWRLRRAAWADNLPDTRRAARALILRDGILGREGHVLDGLDRAVFAVRPSRQDLRVFCRAFLSARRQRA